MRDTKVSTRFFALFTLLIILITHFLSPISSEKIEYNFSIFKLETNSFNTITSDGGIYVIGTNYFDVLNDNGENAIVSDDEDIITMGQISIEKSFISIYRSYLFFDTSSIPDDLELLSAKILLFGESDTSWDFNIVIQNGQPDHPHNPLIKYDYYKTYYSGNGGEIHTSSWSTSEYNEIILNDNGINWINKEGITKFCLRSNRDIDSTPPIQNFETISFYSREKGIDYAPKLVVEYETENNPPEIPDRPSGPSYGEVGESLTYSTSTEDPDDDQVRYKFDWDDGTQSSWTNWVNSGQSASKSKTWNNAGTYYVKAKAQDENGEESSWSSAKTVTITNPGGPPTITEVRSYYADGSDISKGDGFLLQGMELNNTYYAFVAGSDIDWVRFDLGYLQDYTDYDGSDGWNATFNSKLIADPNAELVVTAHNSLGEDTKTFYPDIIPMAGWLVNFVDYVMNYNETDFASFETGTKENPPEEYDNHWTLDASFDFSTGSPENESESPVESTVPEPGVDVDDVGGDYGYSGGIGSYIRICSDKTIEVSGVFEASVEAKSVSGNIGAEIHGTISIENEIIWEEMYLTINGEVTIPVFYIPLEICGIGVEAGVDITPHIEITFYLDPTDNPSEGIVPGLGIKIKEDSGIQGNVGAIVRAYCEGDFVIGEFQTEAGGSGTLYFKTPPDDLGYFEDFELSCWIGGKLRIGYWWIEGWWTYDWTYSESRLSGKEYSETEWAPLERDYVNPDHGAYNTFVWDDSNNSGKMVRNVFPYANPSVAVFPGSMGEKSMIVWAHDNNSKPRVNGMELQYTIWDKSGELKRPKTIPATNDNKLQMDPQIAFDANGNLVCVFVQIDSTVTEETDVFEALEKTEIAYCIYDKNTDSWGNIQILTDNDQIDISPVIATNEIGDVVLVWSSDSDKDHATVTDESIYASFWEGSGWSNILTLADNQPIVSAPKVGIKDSDESICVFTMDNDNNLSTATDQNIHYVKFNQNQIGGIVQYTFDEDFQHTSPSVIYAKNEEPYVIWKKNEFEESKGKQFFKGSLLAGAINSKESPITITEGKVSDPVALQSGSLRDEEAFNFAVGWCGGNNSEKLYTAKIDANDAVEIEEMFESNSKISEVCWKFSSRSFTATFIEREDIKQGGKHCNLSIVYSKGYNPIEYLKIVRPSWNYCYFGDNERLLYPDIPIWNVIVGPVTVVAEVPTAVEKIEKVELFLVRPVLRKKKIGDMAYMGGGIYSLLYEGFTFGFKDFEVTVTDTNGTIDRAHSGEFLIISFGSKLWPNG